MLLPNLTIGDVEDMSLIEIERRIDFVGELKNTKKRNEARDMFGFLHSTIQFATFQGKRNQVMKNNKIFYKNLDKCFSTNKDTNNDDIDNIKDFEEIINVKK